MTQAKHTPGPWTFNAGIREYDGQIMVLAREAGDNGVHICEVTTSTKRRKIDVTPEQDANAALICAAPDLLAALQELIRASEALQVKTQSQVVAINRASAAIAKATGGAA